MKYLTLIFQRLDSVPQLEVRDNDNDNDDLFLLRDEGNFYEREMLRMLMQNARLNWSNRPT